MQEGEKFLNFAIQKVNKQTQPWGRWKKARRMKSEAIFWYFLPVINVNEEIIEEFLEIGVKNSLLLSNKIARELTHLKIPIFSALN